MYYEKDKNLRYYNSDVYSTSTYTHTIRLEVTSMKHYDT